MNKVIKKRVYTIRKLLLFNFLRLLGFFIKKNDNIWVFGENKGTQFTGNPKYFFIYLLNSRKEIRPLWFTKNREVVNQIRKIGGECYLFNSYKSLYFGLKARIYVFSHSIEDIGNYSVYKAFLINLWHGMPIKDTVKYVEINKYRIGAFKYHKNRLIQKLTTFDSYKKCDLFTVTSERTAETIKNAFIHQPLQVKITGEAKNDIFFTSNRTNILKKYNLSYLINKSIITYMPTFRDIFPKDIHQIPFWEDLISDKDKLHIMLHWHPADILCKSFNFSNFEYVENANSMELDVQELLLITDILITDYSSCFIDYLLLNKPIIFFAYDYEEYSKYRGFLYDYKKVIPGPLVYSRNQLCLKIRSYMNKPYLDARKRTGIRKILHSQTTGPFSENIHKAIMDITVKGR